ncbi:hypothetical protein M2G58_22085 [Vibrio vulnificus]|nr:hypothetical protein [Vibrio vulnificus]
MKSVCGKLGCAAFTP